MSKRSEALKAAMNQYTDVTRLDYKVGFDDSWHARDAEIAALRAKVTRLRTANPEKDAGAALDGAQKWCQEEPETDRSLYQDYYMRGFDDALAYLRGKV